MPASRGRARDLGMRWWVERLCIGSSEVLRATVAVAEAVGGVEGVAVVVVVPVLAAAAAVGFLYWCLC